MIARIKYMWASLRWRRFTRHIDRQIAEARKAHQPVAHLLAAKRDFVHAALAGSVGR